MKVSELVAKLQELPQDLDVYTYDGEYTTLDEVEAIAAIRFRGVTVLVVSSIDEDTLRSFVEDHG